MVLYQMLLHRFPYCFFGHLNYFCLSVSSFAWPNIGIKIFKMYIGFCHDTCSHQTTEGTNTFSKSLCKERFRMWLQKYWHEQIALKASVFILWKDVLTGSTDKLLAHYSPSNTIKTTMLIKKKTTRCKFLTKSFSNRPKSIYFYEMKIFLKHLY